MAKTKAKRYGCDKCGGYVDGYICRKCGHDHRSKPVNVVEESPPLPTLPEPDLAAIFGPPDASAFAETPGQELPSAVLQSGGGWVETPFGPVWQGPIKAGSMGGGSADWDARLEAAKVEYRAELDRLQAGGDDSRGVPGWTTAMLMSGRR